MRLALLFTNLNSTLPDKDGSFGEPDVTQERDEMCTNALQGRLQHDQPRFRNLASSSVTTDIR
jgi:hypothetical protein